MSEPPLPTSKERTLVERLDRILCDPYVANRAMARTIREARDVLSANPSAPETTGTCQCGSVMTRLWHCANCGYDAVQAGSSEETNTDGLCKRDDGHDWDDNGRCLHCPAEKPAVNGKAD